MDLYNNQVGIVLGRVMIRAGNTTRAQVFSSTERTIDGGGAKRVEEDEDGIRYLCATSDSEKNP